MKYINGTWRIPYSLTITFDEDLKANPATKTIFEETLTANWAGHTNEDYEHYYSGFGTRTIRLVVSNVEADANNLYILEIADDGTENEWFRYHGYMECTMTDNDVTMICDGGALDNTTIIFGTEPQEVSDEFYNWWTTHAVEVPNMSVNLSKYNLSGDTHTVVIKTLDANGNVIDISNEVVWEKVQLLVVPDNCILEYEDANGEWPWIYGGEPFPQPIPETARISHTAQVEKNSDVSYTYYAETNNWYCSAAAHPFEATDVAIFDSLGGAPVTTLEDYAFCSELGLGNSDMKLERLYLPTSITYIGEGIFDANVTIKEIIYAGTIVEWNNITFHENWNAGGPAFIVTCTDGTIDVPKGGPSTGRLDP